MTDDAPQLPDQTLTLTEGARIPLLEFGTWQLKGNDAVRATSSKVEAVARATDEPGGVMTENYQLSLNAGVRDLPCLGTWSKTTLKLLSDVEDESPDP